MNKLLALLSFLLLFSQELLSNTETDFAPLYYSISNNKDFKYYNILGPLSEKYIQNQVASFFAFRPFYSSFNNIASNYSGNKSTNIYSGQDFLWPLAVTRYWEGHSHQRFFIWFHTEEVDTDGKSFEKLWLMPFFFGKTKQNTSYSAFFPIQGRICDFLGFDYVDFILFPLYARTKKSELYGTNILWPIFSKTRGPGLSKLRIFPLFGKTIKENISEKRFYLWPFFHTAKSLQKDLTGMSFMFFPFFGHSSYSEKNKDFKNNTLLWPLFAYSREIENKNGIKTTTKMSLHAPWPFFTKSYDKKANSQSRYFWPFYGYSRSPNRYYSFTLWPIFTKINKKQYGTKLESAYLLPFYQSHTEIKKDFTKSEKMFWPFIRFFKNSKGDQRIDVFALCPFRLKEVARNYAPLWQIYTKIKKGDKVQRSILCKLFQYNTNKNQISKISLFPLFSYRKKDMQNSEFSILKWLFSIKKSNGKRQFKLFGINLNKTKNNK